MAEEWDPLPELEEQLAELSRRARELLERAEKVLEDLRKVRKRQPISRAAPAEPDTKPINSYDPRLRKGSLNERTRMGWKILVTLPQPFHFVDACKALRRKPRSVYRHLGILILEGLARRVSSGWYEVIKPSARKNS